MLAAMQAPTEAASEEPGAATISNQDNSNKSRSITGKFLADMRSPIGFSLGMYELYAPNLSDSRLGDKSPVFTMLKPRLFASAIFFQAEDGIRYLTVTGVQTCALPI